jgi:hypothetical protein
VRELMGDRYDRIRDNLPDLLDRYGGLRDPDGVKQAIAAWGRERSGAGRRANPRASTGRTAASRPKPAKEPR